VFAFSLLAGHRRQATLLSQAVARGTLPPTLLFDGPDGTGKHYVAQAVAAVLNCLSPVHDVDGFPLDACQTCRSCDRVARRVHTDVIALAPDERGTIRIDAVREVLERTAFRPFEGRRRVVIIRDADTLQPQAQNALLKSLEEPPPTTIFVLTTAVSGLLLPTVRSRCMRLRLSRLAEADVAAVLVRDHEYSPDAARSAAAIADGSVAQALALASTDVVLLRNVAVQLLRQAAASTATSERLQAAATLATSAPKKERARDEVALVLRLAASMLRDIELLNTSVDQRILANPALTAELTALTRPYGGSRARDAFGTINRAIGALTRNAGTKVVSDWVATQI
jgi:DNA polymerase III subunit delta'